MEIKKKTVIEHLDSLIEFYSKHNTKDDYLKKLIIRNLKDVKRRAEKEEKENEDTYWKGWIDKQNEAVKICEICNYRAKADKYNTVKIGGITIELSSDIDKPDVGIIGGFENGKKVVSFYKVDRNQYEPKLELGKATTNKEDLTELMENADLIGKLVFHHQESIESLMLILREMYKT